MILAVHHRSHSFFYSVSNFEVLSYYLLVHSEIIFLVEYYDLPCQILLLGQKKVPKV